MKVKYTKRVGLLMTQPPTRLKSTSFIATILLLQLTFYTTIIFDIPVARQVIGFIYFTFIPGLVIIKLLKFDQLDSLETILYSAGLSIAFLMIIGLIVNDFGFLFGLSQPLSLNSLLISLTGVTLILGIVAYARSTATKPQNSESPTKFSPIGLLFILLPLLSIIGAMWVNIYSDNLILLFTIIAIALVFIICVFFKKLIPPKSYPFVIFMIALALLYHSSIISSHIVAFGSDVNIENFAYKTTADNAHWHLPPNLAESTSFGRVYSMLCVTILPTIYTSMLNIDSVLMFKLIYPFLFAFVPVALYQLWQMYMSKRYAFIAAFLFMSQATFYTEMFGLNRQMMAELFFVLLLLVVLTKKISFPNKIALFLIFSFALVVSHYAVAEIFLFFVIFAFVVLVILKRPNKQITFGMITIFAILMFTWYIYTTDASVFDSFLEFGDYVYRQLGDFFNFSAREETILRGLGLEAAPTIWNWLSRAFAYLTELLIVIGFFGILLKRTKVRFALEYSIFGLAAMGLLGALIVIPGLANTLNMTRFYHILLFFLAPFCVLGVETIINLIYKQKKKILILLLSTVVIVPYFLFQTGFVYETVKADSWSVPLSMYRMSSYRLRSAIGYIGEQDVQGAQWLSKYVNYQNTHLYSDLPSLHCVLTSYSGVFPGYISVLSNTTYIVANGIVYLGWLNVVENLFIGPNFDWNTTEFSAKFGEMNKIYSNGACDIYKKPS